jgi:ectoine hydroxylase-related dioxygenase (phytanoyl-CoA dioxygenase family)
MASSAPRYDTTQIRAFVECTLRDGYCVLPRHFSHALLAPIQQAFAPLLHRHIEREGHKKNRGSERYYVTLPFRAPFAEPALYEDPDILAIVKGLVGDDPVLCQLATDTPLLGSDYQDVHRDAQPLFPELDRETPPFQLAVNFPLVDVTVDNGPVEIAKGTHALTKAEAQQLLARGETRLEPVLMKLGDVMIRDVRGLHRGTPNRTDVPRPMAVIGYSRKWLLRPEVAIRVPRAALATLSDEARRLLRHNPVVEELHGDDDEEIYQSFAY